MFRRKRVVKEGLAPISLKDCIIVRKIVILPKIRRMSYLAGTGGAFHFAVPTDAVLSECFAH